MNIPRFFTEEQYTEMVQRMKKRVKVGVDTDTQGTSKGMARKSQRGASQATARLGIRSAEKAGGTPAPSPPTRPSPYNSKWESAYAHKLQLELLAGEISGWWYEPFSLWLPGQVRYKPDFLVQYPSGELYLLEVKGWSKNLRDGMTRLKIAASIFYCFKWCLVHRLKGGGWAHDVVGTKEGG